MMLLKTILYVFFLFQGIHIHCQVFNSKLIQLEARPWEKNKPEQKWRVYDTQILDSLSGFIPKIICINNTTGGLIFSSSMKFIYRDYDWYNFSTGSFITPIVNTNGGVLTELVTNPNTSGINTSASVGQFIKQSGEQATIRFNIGQPITEISYLTQKLKLYVSGNLSSISNKQIQIMFSNTKLAFNSTLYSEATIHTAETWADYEFNFTDKTIPVEVIQAGGYDQMSIVFAPQDVTTNGTVYYFDDLRSTVKQTIVKYIPYYNWFDFTADPKVENISYVSVLGGTYTKLYDIANDAGVASDVLSKSGLATKFTKIAGSNRYTQLRYNFKEGLINESSITFRLRSLFKPKSISEINILDNTSRMVRLYLRDESGSTLCPQIASTPAYFSLINNWQDLEFTFTSDVLKNYDRLIVMVTPNYTNPVNDNGVSLDEDLNYYFGSLKATNSLENLSTSTMDVEINKKLFLYPNPVNNFFSLSVRSLNTRVFNIYGQKIKDFGVQQDWFDLSELAAGFYTAEVELENGTKQSLQFIKK